MEPNAWEREARAAHLDMIRGLALLGIVIANMPLFASASVYMNMVNVEWWSATAELVPWGLPLGPSADEALRLLHDSNAVYSGGKYEEIFRQRLVDLSHLQNSSLLTIPLTFAMFLFGAYGWQKGWLRDPDRHVAAIRKVWRWSGGIGILFLAFQLWLYHTVDAGQIGFNNAHWAGILIAGPAIALFYMASLLLLIQRSFWRQLFTPLQAAGRMALTNYLLQSFVHLPVLQLRSRMVRSNRAINRACAILAHFCGSSLAKRTMAAPLPLRTVRMGMAFLDVRQTSVDEKPLPHIR
ncbi:hypothetical protein PAT3040_00965 [Paenibacillus agaridevorans]|uniref:DUF418 domain-containing protein n=1 Tax=Paenibacillus agaridevorans TaxID=171404 RepID=A0A2R5EN72_9BACL|nr:hypothetical protein PAT3040_00965 [Paenibacillus agaridevorans]